MILLVSWCVLVLSAAVHPMSPWNHQALVSLREELQLSVLMESGFGNRLQKAAGGFMTRFEAQTVREQPGNIKQMDQVIDILLGKADKDFTAFLMMLRDSNNKVWAEELEKRAEQFKEEGMFVCKEKGPEVHAVLNVKLKLFSLLELIPICVYLCACMHAYATPLYVCMCCTAGGEHTSTLLEGGQSGHGAATREGIEAELRLLKSEGEEPAGTTQGKVSIY